MLSPDPLLAEFIRLARIVANPPEADTLTELCADWIEIIGDEMDPAALRPAVTAHLRESGFWPRPCDILKHGRPPAVRRMTESEALDLITGEESVRWEDAGCKRDPITGACIVPPLLVLIEGG